MGVRTSSPLSVCVRCAVVDDASGTQAVSAGDVESDRGDRLRALPCAHDNAGRQQHLGCRMRVPGWLRAECHCHWRMLTLPCEHVRLRAGLVHCTVCPLPPLLLLECPFVLALAQVQGCGWQRWRVPALRRESHLSSRRGRLRVRPAAPAQRRTVRAVRGVPTAVCDLGSGLLLRTRMLRVLAGCHPAAVLIAGVSRRTHRSTVMPGRTTVLSNN